MVYFDKETNIVRNAAEESKDCVHKDNCDFLKDLRTGARAFNWYPSFVIDMPIVNVFIAADKVKEAQDKLAETQQILMERVADLKKMMMLQWEQNKQAKADWDKAKALKLQVKKDSERAYEREHEQKWQWDRINQNGEKRKESSGKVSPNIPQFTTADQL